MENIVLFLNHGGFGNWKVAYYRHRFMGFGESIVQLMLPGNVEVNYQFNLRIQDST